jgi:UrcA family protein
MNTSKQAHHAYTWLVTLAIAAGSFGASQACVARDSNDVRSEKVSYADLNLSTPAGAAALYGRIEGAARHVCGPDNILGRHFEWKGCCKSAIAAAVAKVNSPTLTAILESKNGGPKLASLQSPRSRKE